MHERREWHGARRRYLTPAERAAFIAQALRQPKDVKLFCLVLANTGCRISEALNLTRLSVDVGEGTLFFECLKRRRRGLFRSVPIPPELLSEMNAAFGIEEVWQQLQADKPLWPWSRMTAYRKVKAVMFAAQIFGAQACPKGLRHGFAVAAIFAGLPLPLIQRWLGHADINTTAIYMEIIGHEEVVMAERMWTAINEIVQLDQPARSGERAVASDAVETTTPL